MIIEFFEALVESLIFLFGTLACGGLMLFFVGKIRDRALLFVSAPLVGFAFASVWFTIFGRIISWDASQYVWIVLCLTSLIFFSKFWRQTSAGESWLDIKKNGCWVIPILTVFALTGWLFDEVWHFSLSGLMANGHWPMRFPYDSTVPLTYHFGFDIVVGAMGSWGMPLSIISDIWTIFLQASLLGLVYLLSASFFSSVRKCLAVVGLWFFVGSFGWIVRPFRVWLPEVFRDVPPFHSTIGNSLSVITYTKSLFVAAGTCLLILLWSRMNRRGDGGFLFLGAILLIGSATSSETLLMTSIAGAVIGSWWMLESWKLRALFATAMFFVAGIIFWQGGILSDAFFSIIGRAETHAMLKGGFGLRDTFVFRYFGGVMDLHSLWSWLRIFIEWGSQAILLVFAWYGWRKWNTVEKASLIGASIAIAIPFVIVYQASPVNIVRFFWNGFFVTNLLGAIVATETFSRTPWRTLFFAGATISGIASMILTSIPIFSWYYGDFFPVYNIALWRVWMFPDERLPKDSVVWVSAPFVTSTTSGEIRDVPIVFGVYAKHCSNFADQKTSEACDAFYYEPSKERLSTLGVTHLFLREDWYQRHAQDTWMKETSLVKKYENPSWSKRLPETWRNGREWTWYLFSL